MASNWTERRVVITGLGVVTPLGNEVETFWQSLLAGQCGIDTDHRLSIASQFDSQIAGEVKDFDPLAAFPSPKEIRRTDRFSQFGIHAAWQALQDSGLDLEQGRTATRSACSSGRASAACRPSTEQHKSCWNAGPAGFRPS